MGRAAMRALLIALALCLLAYWVYQPGLQGPSLLDDGANLAVLQQLTDNPEFAVDVVSGNRSGPLGRPLSMASFALEKIYFDAGVAGVKHTNVLLHLLIALLLYALALALCRVAGYADAEVLALLVTAAWLFSPLLLSTVLYPVQRMAQLSTLGVMMSLNAYVRWRMAPPSKRSAGWLLLLVAGLGFALASKENGILALPLVAVLEHWLFRYRTDSVALRTLLRGYTVLMCSGAVLVALWLGLHDQGYSSRSFTLWQRQLTEAQILWEYVLQLLLPDPDRMGIYHDGHPLASSLLPLWAWLVAGLTALWLARQERWRLAGAGIAFFMVGHSLESTLIPLELYFEHRNYLPAMGLFLTLAALLAPLLASKALRAVSLLISAAWIMGLALVTSSQALLWSDEMTLHMHAVNHHPESARANAIMALLYANAGALPQALAYSAKASRVSDEDPAEQQLRDIVLHCPQSQHLDDSVIEKMILNEQVTIDAQFNDILHFLVLRIIDERCPGVSSTALSQYFWRRLIDPGEVPAAPKTYTVLALLENYRDDFERAHEYTARVLQRTPRDPKTLLMQLYFARGLEKTAEVSAIIVTLEQLQAQNKLSEQQQYNLALLTATTTEP